MNSLYSVQSRHGKELRLFLNFAGFDVPAELLQLCFVCSVIFFSLSV